MNSGDYVSPTKDVADRMFLTEGRWYRVLAVFSRYPNGNVFTLKDDDGEVVLCGTHDVDGTELFSIVGQDDVVGSVPIPTEEKYDGLP